MKHPLLIKLSREQAENWLIPMALFTLAFLLRLSLITKGYYQADCLYLGMQAQKILDTGQMHYLHLLGYPATALLGALFLGIGSMLRIENPAFSINLIGVIFSSLALIPLYFIVKKLFGGLTAFLSVILIMIHPAFLAVSVFGNSHMPFLLFFLLSIHLMLRFRETGSPFQIIASAACAGLMLANRPQEIIHFLTLSCLYFMPLLPDLKKKGSLKHYFLFWVMAASTTFFFYLPLIIKILSTGSAATQIHQSSSVSRFVMGNLSLYALSVTTPAIIKSFTLVGAALILIGLYLTAKHNLRLFLFLLSWLIPPLLFFGSLVTTLPRYHLNIIIPLAIALCFCLSQISQRNRFSLIAAGIIYGILISALFSSIYPILNFRHHNDLMKEYGLWIKKHTEPSAIIYAHEEALIIGHFANRRTKTPPFRAFKESSGASDDKQLKMRTRDFLKETLQSGIPVYATSVALSSNDPQHRFKALLAGEFNLEYISQATMEEWHQGSTSLILYREKLYRVRLKQGCGCLKQ